MRSDFVKDVDDLLDSVLEFDAKPEFWKSILGGGAKYFVHFDQGGKNIFALSKFCAFKGISAEKYVSGYRHYANGTVTQKHISKILGKRWIEVPKIKKEIKTAFKDWISDFYPNYSTDNSFIITIPKSQNIKKKRLVTPEELFNSLELNKKIGSIGEEIALEFEKNRLLNLGVKNPIKYIDHISKNNISAGFDIYSSYSEAEERFIEVKTSLKKTNELYITENEIETLQELGEKAYIYLVSIKDIENKEGVVYQMINNPINQFEKEDLLIPIAYKVILK